MGYALRMRFRLGLMIGGAVGYVLGARAGRERYEEIRRWWGTARRNPSLEQLAKVGQGLSDMSRSVVAEGLEKTSDAIRRES